MKQLDSVPRAFTLQTSPFRLPLVIFSVLLTVVAVFPAVSLLAQTDLDAFMSQVLARRDDNWKRLQQYILDEREQIELRGPTRLPLWGERRDYTWYVREGYFVRSPVKVNGVEISDADRRKYEADFLRRTKARDRGMGGFSPQPSGSSLQSPGSSLQSETTENVDGILRQVREPQFISSAYFLRFRFEQGKYALVGREMLDGHEVLHVEYYPTNLFTERQRRRMARSHDRNDPKDAEIQRMMNKVALVSLWISPESHQIVKYTFDNIDFDFMPARWLVQLDTMKASMTMSQAFPDVWLPRDLEFVAVVEMAMGRFDAKYTIEYRDYRQADVKSTFSVGAAR